MPPVLAPRLDEVVPWPWPASTAAGARRRLDDRRVAARVLADPGLLERVVANLVDNALRSRGTARPRAARQRRTTRASSCGSSTAARGARGASERACSTPFQRLGDDPATGTALGLGLARRRARVHRGDGRHLTAEDTPGGGLTMVSPCLPHGRPQRDARVDPGARRRRRAADRCARCAINLRAHGYDVARRRRGGGAARRRHDAPRRHRPRPRPARHGRHRRHRGPARLDERADHRAVRARRRRQGRGTRPRRRRLRHQAVRHGRAARPAPGRRAAGAGRPATATPVVDAGDFTVDLAAKKVRRADGDGGAPHPHRVGRAGAARPPPRQARRAARAAARGLGPRYGPETNYLRVYVAQLRRKLERDPATRGT